MAETTTPTGSPVAPPTTDWTKSLNTLLTAGSSIFSGYTNSQVASQNAKAANAAAKAAAANAQSNQSSVMKYVLIGGGILVAVIAVIFLLKKK